MKFSSLALLMMLCGGTAMAADQVYKWTDADGTTHFSSSPPEGAEAQEVKLPKAPPPPPPPAEPDDGPAAQRAAACEMAKQNLDTLRNNATVETQQEDGSRRTLSMEEREVMRAAEEKRVEMFCEPEAPAQR